MTDNVDLEPTIEDLKRHTLLVLGGAKGGLDEESLRTAVNLSMAIERDSALLQLLQTREVIACGEDGETVIELASDQKETGEK